MKFKIGADFADCLQIYNTLSEQEKNWFGVYDYDDDVIIHRKMIKVDSVPAGFCEVGDCSKLPGGLDGDCVVYIAVAPDYRQRGIGFQLVNEVVQSFKDNGFRTLTYRVNQKNIPSIKLAESCGLTRLPQESIDEDIRATEYVYVV